MQVRKAIAMIILSSSIVIAGFLTYLAVQGWPGTPPDDHNTWHIGGPGWGTYVFLTTSVERVKQEKAYDPASQHVERGWPFVYKTTMRTGCCGVAGGEFIDGRWRDFPKPAVERTWVVAPSALLVNLLLPLLLLALGWFGYRKMSKEVDEEPTTMEKPKGE